MRPRRVSVWGRKGIPGRQPPRTPVADLRTERLFRTGGEAGRARSTRLQTAVVDAMTTNETFWFRDMAHFRIPIDGVLAEKPSRLRVWSAAASTGQEAYTTAICLQDAMQNGRVARNLSYEIVGTDISPTALQEAQGELLRHGRRSRLSDDQRRRYFHEQGGCIEVLPQYRKRVCFRVFNLLAVRRLGRFDVGVLPQCAHLLLPGTQARHRLAHRSSSIRAVHLFLGSTESMSRPRRPVRDAYLAGGLVYPRPP